MNPVPEPVHRPARRRGLSTLEMVLCLPILLLVMALMINFGTAGAWRVRTLAVARHAVWSSRAPRWGLHFPRPQYWPATAHIAAGSDPDATVLDDPRVDQPVARGPTLPSGTVVNRDLLDPTLGMRRGAAAIQREFPLLRRLGRYQLRTATEMLDRKWQFWQMHWTDAAGNRQHGIPANLWRRIPVIYALPKAPASLQAAYVQAVLAILRAPFRRDLFPLDRDEEWLAYHRRFPPAPDRPADLAIGPPPDFHPRLRRFCDLDHAVAQKQVDNLIDRIRGRPGDPPVHSLAWRMARAFIDLYQRVIRQSQDPAEIAQLQSYVAILSQFLQTVP